MAVSKSTMHFREERAIQLEQMADLLERCIGNIDTSPIYKASGQLRDESKILPLKGGIINPDVWGYDIDDFEITLDTLKHVKPTTITGGKIILNLKLRANVNAWNDMNDPFLEMNFNVKIKGVGDKVYHFGFHIDRHDLTTTPDEPHPVYHIQYDINPNHSKEFDYGSVMYVDTPRLLHCPLDFILGISFLTSNFFPTAFLLLNEERGFVKLNEEYQIKIWKPYFHTLADNWKPFQPGNITWKPVSHLCPTIV